MLSAISSNCTPCVETPDHAPVADQQDMVRDHRFEQGFDTPVIPANRVRHPSFVGEPAPHFHDARNVALHGFTDHGMMPPTPGGAT